MPSGKRVLINVFALLLVLPALCACLEKTEPGGSDVAFGRDAGAVSNNRPVISGSPETAILIGDGYAFTPSASDADGDALTFSIRNKPYWADFDAASGTLSGSVSLGETGEYRNILISVSDGKISVSLPYFSIAVVQSANGSMELNWTAPIENTDGTPLLDLVAFKIYYGRARGRYPYSIRIDNPSIDTFLVDNLLPATYYVVATSINSAGVESAYSNVAVRFVRSN